MFIQEFVKRSLHLLNCLYIYHWVTKQYRVHIALEQCYEQLLDLLDEFIECYIGSSFDKQIIDKEISINIVNSKEAFLNALNDYIKFIESAQNYGELTAKRELLAILDEILNLLHRFIYRLNFE